MSNSFDDFNKTLRLCVGSAGVKGPLWVRLGRVKP